MRIWIFSHYASVPSIGQYTGHFDLAKELVKSGCEVTIFASSFSHYRFEETVLAVGEKSKSINYDGVGFVWVRTTKYTSNNWRRILSMVVYFWRAIALAVRMDQQPDVCIGVCVHPLAGLAAWLVARKKKARFVYEIRDLWPLVLIEMGRIGNRSLVARSMRALEYFLLIRADKVFGAWRYFDRYVREVGVSPEKVVWVPQFAVKDRMPAECRYPSDESPFTIMYAGGIVNFMALDIVLQCARLFQRCGCSDVHFRIVGGGQELPRLRAWTRNERLTNVEFIDPVPKEELYALMEGAHAFVISMRSLPHHVYGVSLNKLYDYMVMERPIVYATRSTYNPVAEANAGIAVEPENPEAMFRAFSAIKSMSSDQRREMGRNAKAFLLKNHEVGVVANRVRQALRDICAE